MFVYRTDCESPASFLCSYPMANISLMRNKKHVCMNLLCINLCICIYLFSHECYLLKMYIQVLTFGQAYQMSLQLDMPDSPTNQELGMLMIKTTCFSGKGGQVASSARSVSC